jgi:hypothetical protein
MKSENEGKAGKFFIKSDNIGFKLLQRSGWEGGGLGKTNQGIVYPIKTLNRQGRTCLGIPQVLTRSLIVNYQENRLPTLLMRILRKRDPCRLCKVTRCDSTTLET